MTVFEYAIFERKIRADERAKVLDEVKNEMLYLVKYGIFATRNDLAEKVSDIIESHE